MKVCRTCTTEKPDSDFYRASKGGLFPDCKPCTSALRAAFYRDNRDTLKARATKWANNNPGASRTAMRRYMAARSGAAFVIPGWADVEKIDAVYRAARHLSLTAGISHSVDHIVPIKHPLVCGLHCEANLQVLTRSQNSSKGSRWWPDMPDDMQEARAFFLGQKDTKVVRVTRQIDRAGCVTPARGA